MATTKDGGVGSFAGFLPLLQLLLAGAIVGMWWWKPYVLANELLWLGPTTSVYVRNPALVWLLVAQLPIMVCWAIFAKPKAIWQWALTALAGLTTIAVWMLTSDPPPYLG